MFQFARLKLTVWYLMIIMTVSGLFSFYIYHQTVNEVEASLAQIYQRLLDRGVFTPEVQFSYQQEVRHAQNQIAKQLVYVNIVIFCISSWAGLLLADQTFTPIEKAHNEQRRFIADASHELKTPLTSLKTSIEVALRDKKLTLKQAKSLLQDNLIQTDSLTNLTNNLLDLSRVSSTDSRFTQINLADIAKTVKQQVAPLIQSKQLKYKEELESAYIKGIPEQINRLFILLLDNAIKYTPKKGGITLKITARGRYAIIAVSDTGKGIPADKLDDIFKRFYQVDPSRSQSAESGYGLGLALADQIVETHKGSIEVESQLKKGTTFTIKFPVVKPA